MIRALLVPTVVAFAMINSPAVAQEKLKYQKLHEALYELREARKELGGIKGNVGGHKKKAIDAAAEAVRSVKLILVVNDEDTSPIKRDKDFYKKWKDYPRARAALEDLRDAKTELEDAKGDFEGNKKRALKDIEVASGEIRALLDALRRGAGIGHTYRGNRPQQFIELPHPFPCSPISLPCNSSTAFGLARSSSRLMDVWPFSLTRSWFGWSAGA